MEEWFPADVDNQRYMEEWTKNVPYDKEKYDSSPMEFLARGGGLRGSRRGALLRAVPAAALRGADLDGATVDGGRPASSPRTARASASSVNGKPVVGFRTPSRKLEVLLRVRAAPARNEDTSDLIARIANSKGKNRAAPPQARVPVRDQPVAAPTCPSRNTRSSRRTSSIMTSFKWNVHNHGRTANLKWCSEIVHSNPAWMHPDTAARFGLESGDWIEVTRLPLEERGPRHAGPEARHRARSPPRARAAGGRHARRAPARHRHLELPGPHAVHRRRQGRARELGRQRESAGMDREGLQGRRLGAEHVVGGHLRRRPLASGAATPATAGPRTTSCRSHPDFISGQQAFNDTVVRIRKLT